MKTPKTMKKDEIAQIKTKKWHWAWSWGLGILVIITLGIVFAEPVEDGDLWWQMAYGRYMIENRTLIPDHTVFTWSLTDGSLIYCAWIAEISLYLLHKTGGLPLLFAFRYLCLIIFVLMIFFYARRMGVVKHPLTWLIILLGLLMSDSGAYLKPEIFSYTLMIISVGTWFLIKSAKEEKAWQYCYLFPLLMVIWVNSHGGFIFGLAFLAIMGIGEGLNICFSKDIALSPKVRRHFMIALILSFFSIFITPYGWQYPVQLANNLLGQSQAELKAVHAYSSIFHPKKQLFHYVDYLYLSILTLFILFWHRIKTRRFDYALIFTNLVFGFLYIRFLRTTYFWVPIFSFSAIYLLADKPARLWPAKRGVSIAMGGLIALIFVFLSGRAGLESMCRPFSGRYLGFGISYPNPVQEAEYIRKNFAGYRLGNGYDSGGYLLWALWPDTKVMIDPRYFPFKKWFNQYLNLAKGRKLKEFLEKYPCEVWCYIYKYRKPISWFLLSPDWKMAFYGPSGVIFVRKEIEIPKGLNFVGKGMGEIKNLNQALLAFDFVQTISDWDTAREIMSGIKKRFKFPNQRPRVEGASNFLDGKLAYLERDYEKAVGSLEVSRLNSAEWSYSYLTNSYTHMACDAWVRKEDQKALSYSRAALASDPEDIYALFNTGITEWYMNKQNNKNPKNLLSLQNSYRIPFQPDNQWKKNLGKFVEKARQVRQFSKLPLTIAEEIFRGTYIKRPPLVQPPKPPLPVDNKY